MQSFTSEDLLLYIYGETSAQESSAIEAALQLDWNLKEKMELLKASIAELDQFTATPSSKSINNILEYAHKSVEELAPHA